MALLIKKLRTISLLICTISSLIGFFAGFVEDLVPKNYYASLLCVLGGTILSVQVFRYFSVNLYWRNFFIQIYYGVLCLTLFLISGIGYNWLKDQKISAEQNEVGDISEPTNPSLNPPPHNELSQPSPEASVAPSPIITSPEKPEGEKAPVRPPKEVAPKTTPVPPPVVEPRYRHEIPPRVGPNTGL